MSTATFQLNISRVNGPLFSGDVTSVSLPAAAGILQVLANHEPLITPILKGEITVVKADAETESFNVTSGTLEVRDSIATILI